MGNATFSVRGVLAQEPDRVATASIFGPRVLIASAALPETGLIQPGSILSYELRAALPAGINAEAMESRLRAAFPGRGWRLRDARHAVPLSGSWTGFPSDFLGMDVTVSVTSDGTSEEPASPGTLDARRSGGVA